MWLLYAFSGPLLWAISTHIDKFLVDKYFRHSDTAVLMVFTALLGVIALPAIWLFDPKVLARIRAIEAKGDFENPEYMQLLIPNYYAKHICRFPFEQWPEPLLRAFNKINQSLAQERERWFSLIGSSSTRLRWLGGISGANCPVNNLWISL